MLKCFEKVRYFHVFSKLGVTNPRPRKEFLRHNLELKLDDFSIFWVFFCSFCQNLAQKSIFLEIFQMRPRDRFELARGWTGVFKMISQKCLWQFHWKCPNPHRKRNNGKFSELLADQINLIFSYIFQPSSFNR
jgi:hypothetical protein